LDRLHGIFSTLQCRDSGGQISLCLLFILRNLVGLCLAAGLDTSDLLFLDAGLFVLNFEILEESVSDLRGLLELCVFFS
jgi:hypothetical protein